MSEQSKTTALDRTRRYLRPVQATIISDDPDGAHLAVYEWLPMFGEWATGPGLCGESMRQGPLPEGTTVTCASCLKWQPRYERMLAPGYRPEDDDPEVLRRRAEAAEREVAAARTFAGEMRDFCSPHGVAADYADRLIEAMDRAKGEHRDTAADTLAAEWHRRYQRLEELSNGPNAQVAIVEHLRGELVGLRGALGVLLGGRVEGGTADLLGWSYYQEWRRRQEGLVSVFRNSAGREAARIRARARRGPWGRVTAWVGLNPEATRADAVAARWELGAKAEKETARAVRRLRRRGWRIRHDLRLAGRRFNVDHVLVSPCGTAVVVADTKRWHAGQPTAVVDGRLWCGLEDRTGEAEKAARYALLVGRALKLPGVAVWPLLIVHRSPMPDRHVQVDTGAGMVQVVAAGEVLGVLRNAPGGWSWSGSRQVARRVDEVLVPYR